MRPAARDGDLHVCPDQESGPAPHVGGAISASASDVLINGQRTALVGDGASCQGPRSSVIEGSRGVFANSQSIARVGDPTDHGGRVVHGSGNVFVGHEGKQASPQPAPQPATVQQAIVLHADYDQSAGLDATSAEHGARLVRPGAVLLANLDIDLDPATIAPGNRIRQLDGYQARLRPTDDDVFLSRLDSSPYGPVAASQVELQLHPADANRVRFFRDGHPQAVLGVTGSLTSAGGSAAHRHRYVVPGGLPIALKVEAVTLAGDPRKRAPAGRAPAPPDAAFPATQPSGSTATALYPHRVPSDVWVTIRHTGGATPRDDLSLYTIAPFLLIPNTQQVEKLFVVSLRATGKPNHNMVHDLSEACRAIWPAAGEVDLPSDPTLDFTPHTPSTGATKRVYVIGDPDDVWIQDQLSIGYCYAPGDVWMHVVLHCRRQQDYGRLPRFVRKRMARAGFGVFDGLHGAPLYGQDFGGNIEVSPPIAQATPAMGRDLGGPSVPAHPPAPFGKVLVGDCSPRGLHPHTRRFLLAQKVQPVLPVDTSWLAVGHVDEFMVTVPAPSEGGFRLLMASADVARWLLDDARRIAPPNRTGLHVGKHERDGYAELRIEDLDAEVRQHPIPSLLWYSESLPAPPNVSARDYNETLQRLILTRLESKLRRGLGLSPEHVILLPQYYRVPDRWSETSIRQRHGDSRTCALTVASVNCQPVNGHLLMPRPFSVRVPTADAQRILRDTLDSVGLRSRSPVVTGAGSFRAWFPPGEPIWKICAYYADLTATERAALTGALRAPTVTMASVRAALGPAGWAAVEAARGRITPSAGSPALPGPAVTLAPSARLTTWARVHVTEAIPRVDLFEAYLRSVLEPLGLRLHFIDDWYYHINMGNTHCGTNTARRPLERDGALRWWDDYHPERDLDYEAHR